MLMAGGKLGRLSDGSAKPGSDGRLGSSGSSGSGIEIDGGKLGSESAGRLQLLTHEPSMTDADGTLVGVPGPLAAPSSATVGT